MFSIIINDYLYQVFLIVEISSFGSYERMSNSSVIFGDKTDTYLCKSCKLSRKCSLHSKSNYLIKKRKWRWNKFGKSQLKIQQNKNNKRQNWKDLQI